MMKRTYVVEIEDTYTPDTLLNGIDLTMVINNYLVDGGSYLYISNSKELKQDKSNVWEE